ncbi:MAG TPA: hypothetical protein VFL03_03325 [Candidatus Limnocylindrales bacterium]|jgi:hypothetical protein|nr:hypothetical protein [Candidatus Limnocylindrales bacterium]
MDFERRTTVWVGVEEAFDFFADPANLPLYVPTVRLEEAVAVDGDPDAEPDPELGKAGPEARFVPDRKNHRVEWGIAGEDYGGSIEIAPGTASSSDVVIRLRTRDDVDEAEVRQMIEQVVRTVGRHLSGR